MPVRQIPKAVSRPQPLLWVAAVILLAIVCSLGFAPQAHAFSEPNDLEGTGCLHCHPDASFPDMPCEDCHGDDDGGGPDNGYEEGNFQGPHGGYTATTSKCDNCHQVHGASGIVLLPEPTIVATCFTCHDGTGGWGVYGLIEARTGSPAGGGHSYEATNAIPGGDSISGGVAYRTFKGPDGDLICTDCHSPHGTQTVAAFKGDRRRIRAGHPSVTSDRLLLQRPSGADATSTVYGSDWCASCHEGRPSGGMVMNHPVDGSSETSSPFDYGNLAVLASDDPTSSTILSTLGGIPFSGLVHNWPADVDPSGNRGYLMPYPRTAQQSGHYPICQQCHEDTRYVGELTGDGSIGDAATATIAAADAVEWVSGPNTWFPSVAFDNPAFQNFPHETENSFMLVEKYDDLCLNCHPTPKLP